MKNHVFEKVDRLPPGKRLLGTKYVFKTKVDANGKLERFKARLVAKGYLQRFGEDFTDTSSPVVLFNTLKLVFGIAAQEDLEVHAIDVETAFLNAPLDEDLYIVAPPGFVAFEPGSVLKLTRALYGLKQAGRNWNLLVSDQLRGLGLLPLEHSDVCLFVKKSKSGKRIILALYVDDMVLVFDQSDAAEIAELKRGMGEKFKIKDLGDAQSILGVRITRNRAEKTITLDQGPYAEKILGLFGFGNPCRIESVPARVGKEAETPAEALSRSEEQGDSEERGSVTTGNFASVVGAIGYLANQTRPDLAYAWNALTRSVSAPDAAAVRAAKYLLRYIKGKPDIGITLRSVEGGDQLVAYSDSDWGNDAKDGVSISGSLFILANAAVGWQSQKQKTVSVSSSEAEYVSASEASRTIIWYRTILSALGLPQEPTVLFMDNQTSIRFATEESCTPRRKHINVKYHYIREQILSGLIQPKWIPTAEQLADIFTKPLGRIAFARLRDTIMGLS